MENQEPKAYTLQPILPNTELKGKFLKGLNQRNTPASIEDFASELKRTQEYTQLPEEERLTLLLFFELITDFSKQGWSFEYDYNTENVIATPPDQVSLKHKDVAEIKSRIKKGLEEARNQQLKEDTVSKFIYEMERPRWHKGRQVSILQHFLKPTDFYNDIKRRLDASEEIREELLKQSVDPYLQLVSDERDSFTNIRLKDIWRYARYSWSLPLSSQPGRQMLYLIRDRSRDFHPIMGIGALGSSVVQITCRDSRIGWTLDSLNGDEHIEGRMRALEDGLIAAISDVFYEDLLTEEEINNPTDSALNKLSEASKAPISRSKGKLNSISYINDAKTPVYKSKRANELHELLYAQMRFNRAKEEYSDYKSMYECLISSKDGKRALGNAIRAIKKKHVGSSIMDITTCGAIPPYNEVLGGKLVSLLMASPQVINDYFKKYKGAVSEIASRIKGQPVIKPSHLVLLGTTSLYYTGSSQYNRIRYNTAKGKLQYQYVGKTKGYGSVQLSNKTYKTLQELLKKHPELQPENAAFAAGVNYKMRTIGSGLGYMGLRKLQQHESPRLVYTVPLAVNWREYLTGVDESPNYLFDLENATEETQHIIDFWKTRWYMKRLRNSEVLERIGEKTGRLRISGFLERDEAVEKADLERASEVYYKQLNLFGGEDVTSQRKVSWKIIAGLKNQRTSFAERLTKEELEALHISTKLDELLSKLLEQGKRIYLVGSPGDGKTHILKKYIDYIEEKRIFYNLDASAVDEEYLIKGLQEVIRSGNPSIVAINEGPLRKMLQKLPKTEEEELKEQLDAPFLYGKQEEKEYRAVVVNLSSRQILSKSIVEEALRAIVERVDYGEDAPRIVHYNVSMLKRHRVRERVVQLLGMAAKGGSHVTMHQLLGFISYMITSGISSPEYSNRIAPYYSAIFNQENPLYTLLNKLDPVNITHPIVDMELADRNFERMGTDWITGENVLEEGDELTFDDLKRKYFFEAPEGHKLFSMLPEDYQIFHELLDSSRTPKQLAKKRIMEAMSRFFGQKAESDRLQIWTGLKYEAKKDPSVFISTQDVREENIEIYVPRLRKEVSELLEFEPSHFRLTVKTDREGHHRVGLDINLELWLALMKIKNGISALYQDPVIVRRLTTFMSQLSAQLSFKSEGMVKVSVQDAKSGQVYEVNISYEEGKKGKYVW